MKALKSVAKILLLSLIASCLIFGSAFSADRYGSLRIAKPVSDKSGPITVDAHPWEREGGGGGNSEELYPTELYIADDLESTNEEDLVEFPDAETFYAVLLQTLTSAR